MAVNTNRYQEAMNSICDTSFPVKAAEMLEIAKKAADRKNMTITNHVEKEELNMKTAQKSNENIILRIAAGVTVTAACLGLAGTVGYAMIRMKRNIDAPPAASTSVTAQTTETAAVTTETTTETAAVIPDTEKILIGEEQSDELFTIRLDSIAGDTLSPKLIWDVTVKDAAFAAEYDKIQLSAYILDEDNYANHMDKFNMCQAFGEKDPETDNLYHVCMDGPSAFMQRNSEVVAAVKNVRLQNSSGTSEVKNVNMEYRFTVPDSMRKFTQITPLGITLSSEKVDYDLLYADFGAYESLFAFAFDYLGTSLADGATNYSYDVHERFDAYWNDFAKTIVLTVDGKDYMPKELGASHFVENSDVLGAGRCSTWMSFPGFDYKTAKLITITAGGQTFSLKDEETETGDIYGDILHHDDYADIIFSSGAVDYELYQADYFTKELCFQFKYDFSKFALAGGETDYHNFPSVYENFDEDWAAFSDHFVLTVDGTEYKPSSRGGIYCYQDGEYLGPGICSVPLYFPAIDYDSAVQIELKADDKTVILKGNTDEAKSKNGM